jgi:serine/threonine-protein kinase
MEFVEGTDLRRYLKKHGLLDNDRAIEIAHDVALGLGAAHKRGIVHRDVKPQNVMVNDSGLVKLTDFGIASMYKDAEAERLTTTGMTLGTVQYYAPEQAQGEIVSPAADIYALGIVMYEMLAGRTPFDGDTPVAVAMRHIQDTPEPPSTYNPRISPGLERIILRCLEKDPRDRYRDGDALAYALENLARAPRRTTGVGTPAARPQFAPLGLPSNDVRPMPGTGPAAYGGPAVASNPGRLQRSPSQPMGGRTGSPMGGTMGGPTMGGGYGGGRGPYSGGGFDDYDAPPGMGTVPHGPAAGTVPRSPSTGRTSGAFGPPPRPDSRRGNGPIVGVVVAAAVLLLGLTCFLVLELTGGFGAIAATIGGGATPTPTVQLIRVPDFRGQQYTAAQAQASTMHLKVTENLVPSDRPLGEVTDQQPPPDGFVPINSFITLSVSNGPNKVSVPDVVKKSLSDAEVALTNAKLKYNIVAYQQSLVVPNGYIISTDPLAGTQVAPGSVVNLVVSTGAPTPTATPVTPTPTCSVGPGTPTPTPPGSC